MFENMSAIILTQNSQNFYSFCYFGIGSDSFYFQIKNYQWQIYIVKKKKEKKLKNKANVSATYGGLLQCHKL